MAKLLWRTRSFVCIIQISKDASGGSVMGQCSQLRLPRHFRTWETELRLGPEHHAQLCIWGVSALSQNSLSKDHSVQPNMSLPPLMKEWRGDEAKGRKRKGSLCSRARLGELGLFRLEKFQVRSLMDGHGPQVQPDVRHIPSADTGEEFIPFGGFYKKHWSLVRAG